MFLYRKRYLREIAKFKVNCVLNWPETQYVVPFSGKMKCPFKINWDLGFVVGTIKGDGTTYIYKGRKKNGKWVSGRSYKIDLKVTDKEFASRFNKSITKVLRRKKLYSLIKMKLDNKLAKKPRFRVCASDKKFYLWFNKLGYTGIYQLLGDREFARGFIRGMVDSEGTTTKKYIRIVNKDEALLFLVKEALFSHFSIEAKKYLRIIKKIPIFMLVIYRKEYRQRFYDRIGTFKTHWEVN